MCSSRASSSSSCFRGTNEKKCLGFFSFSKTLKVLRFPFSNPKPSASVSSSASSSSLTSRAQKRLSSSAAESHYSQNARKHR